VVEAMNLNQARAVLRALEEQRSRQAELMAALLGASMS